MNSTVKIPEIKEAYSLLVETQSMPNVIEHSELVMFVTSSICEFLKDSTPINRSLAEIGALLHDVTKSWSIINHERHDDSGGKFMRSKGYPEIAEIIERHVHIGDFNPDSALTEYEIVHYADKRVKHSDIVSLDERIDDLIKCYGKTPEIIEDISSRRGFLTELEIKIQSNMTKNINDAICIFGER